MGVFLVRWADGKSFDNIETDDGCVADLVEAPAGGGMVLGSALFTRRGAHGGERVVHGRRSVAFTSAAVASVEDCRVRFVEETG